MTKITYNGKTTELADGYIATLPCKDLKMETDVVVEAPEGAEAPTVEEWDGTGVVIEGLVKLISFTLSYGTEFQAEEGMTWGEWCESDYNAENFSVQWDTVRIGNTRYNDYVTYNGVRVTPTDLIVNGGVYGTEAWTSGGSNE